MTLELFNKGALIFLEELARGGRGKGYLNPSPFCPLGTLPGATGATASLAVVQLAARASGQVAAPTVNPVRTHLAGTTAECLAVQPLGTVAVVTAVAPLQLPLTPRCTRRISPSMAVGGGSDGGTTTAKVLLAVPPLGARR